MDLRRLRALAPGSEASRDHRRQALREPVAQYLSPASLGAAPRAAARAGRGTRPRHGAVRADGHRAVAPRCRAAGPDRRAERAAADRDAAQHSRCARPRDRDPVPIDAPPGSPAQARAVRAGRRGRVLDRGSGRPRGGAARAGRGGLWPASSRERADRAARAAGGGRRSPQGLVSRHENGGWPTPASASATSRTTSWAADRAAGLRHGRGGGGDRILTSRRFFVAARVGILRLLERWQYVSLLRSFAMRSPRFPIWSVLLLCL